MSNTGINNTTIKNSKPVLPEGWRLAKLGVVTTVVNGTTPDSGTPDYWNGDIVWITPTDLGKLPDKYIRDSDRRISQTGFDSCNLTLVSPGSVVLSSRAPIGHLGIAIVPLCTNQGCKSFVPGADVDSEFLYFVLKRSVWQLQCLGSGATFTEVSKSQLEKFEIPLPPLAEQKRIAGILNEQMKVIERSRQATEEQLEAAQSLPAAYLREVFVSEEVKKWQIKKSGDILDIRDGTHDTPPYIKSGVPLVTSKNLIDGKIDFATALEISETDHQEIQKRSAVNNGDILMAMIGTIGNPVIVNTDRIFSIKNVALFKTHNNPNIIPEYLCYLLDSTFIKNQFEKYSQGGMQKFLSLKVLRSLEILLPTIKEQEKITKIIESKLTQAKRISDLLYRQITEISLLPSALLCKAFQGEL